MQIHHAAPRKNADHNPCFLTAHLDRRDHPRSPDQGAHNDKYRRGSDPRAIRQSDHGEALNNASAVIRGWTSTGSLRKTSTANYVVRLRCAAPERDRRNRSNKRGGKDMSIDSS